MGHDITALIVPEPFDDAVAREWDVAGVPLGHGLRLVHISDSYVAYQQHQRGVMTDLDLPNDLPDDFPRGAVLADLAYAVTGRPAVTFALVMTEYFGGVGEQWAVAFADGRRVAGVADVNGALEVLGVRAAAGMDAFDTVGLSEQRRAPESLDRYWDLCKELGL
ncbi:hypothetical protein [Actinoplanes subglobosus]|uniref:Uncharacterized protein n=1 Tax=Actinoplanes subglobosus TaxID=1547892 RepID=A0ABV8J7R2_9ACTN